MMSLFSRGAFQVRVMEVKATGESYCLDLEFGMGLAYVKRVDAVKPMEDHPRIMAILLRGKGILVGT